MMKEKNAPFALFMLVSITLGSFLFGYQTAIIAGALSYLDKTYVLSALMKGFVASMLLLGALLGAIIAGWIADRFGRKKALLITAILFTIGALISAAAADLYLVLIGRFITGMAVGLISIVAPMYIGEISAPHFRGMFVSAHQLAITFGILVAFGINYLFAFDEGWRWMFGLGAIPSLLQLVALFFCSESPSWLLSKGKDKASFAVLEQLRRDHEWESHLKEMKSSAHFKQGTSWGLLFSSQYMRVLLIGLILSVFQQITGINTVIYFAPEIFRQAGFTGETASLLPTMGIGILNIIATTLSLILLDRSGRRILLQIGTFGMLISLVLFVWALMMNHSSTALISTMSIFGYVFFFSMSLGPVTWVVLAEIYPLRIRGTAMAIVIFANWLANYLLTLTFLDLLDLLTAAGTFGLFALLSGLAWWFITKFLPETKGKTLEQIEKLMCKKT